MPPSGNDDLVTASVLDSQEGCSSGSASSGSSDVQAAPPAKLAEDEKYSPQVTELAEKIEAKLLESDIANRINFLFTAYFYAISQFLNSRDDTILADMQELNNALWQSIIEILKNVAPGLDIPEEEKYKILNQIFSSLNLSYFDGEAVKAFFAAFYAACESQIDINPNNLHEDIYGIDKCELELRSEERIDRVRDKPGLFKLTDAEIAKAQNQYFHKEGYAVHTIMVDDKRIHFSIIYKSDTNKFIFITTPLLDEQYQPVAGNISTALGVENLEDFHIIAPLKEPDINYLADKESDIKPVSLKESDTNRIVTGYKAPAQKFVNFNPKQFEFQGGLFERADDSSLGKQSLGTQSFFDNRTGAYHHIGNVANIVELIEANLSVNRENILQKNAENNPISRALELLGKLEVRPQHNYGSFFNYAWQATFSPDIIKYYMCELYDAYQYGWAALVGALLRDIVLCRWVNPIKNIVKFIVEWPLKVIAESFNFYIHKLYMRTPTTGFRQVARSAGLIILKGFYYLFEGLRLLVRTVTAPMASAKAGWKVNPILGILSVICTVAAGLACAYFALPWIAGLGTKCGIVKALDVMPGLPKFAAPTMALLGQFGVAGTSALKVVAAVFQMGVAAIGVNGMREWIVARRSAAKEFNNNYDSPYREYDLELQKHAKKVAYSFAKAIEAKLTLYKPAGEVGVEPCNEIAAEMAVVVDSSSSSSL